MSVDRDDARAMLGVTGDDDVPQRPLLTVVREGGATLYPLLALGVLVVVDQFQTYAFFVLGPEVSNTLGLSKSSLAALINLKVLVLTLATLPIAASVQKVPRRGLVSIVTAFGWSLATLATGFATSTVVLAAILFADGASTGSTLAVHRPLLLDSYPPEVRVRTLSIYRGFDNVGNIAAPALVALLTAVFAFTWRGVFVVFGVMCLTAAVVSLRLRDPGFGVQDQEKLRRAAADGDADELTEDDVALGFSEIVRRLLMIQTVRRILVGYAALGMLFVPLNTYLIFFLDERWNMGPGGRGLLFAGLPLFSIAALALFARRGEDLFRKAPSQLLGMAATLLSCSVIAIAIGVASPVFGGMVLGFGVGFACFAMTYPALETSLLSVVPARMRPHAAALSGIYLAGIGGTLGLVLLGSIDRRFGIGGAIASIVVPGLLAGGLLRRAAREIDADLDALVEEIIEEQEVQAQRAADEELPLLACRNVNFSYGQVQVLFDVDFHVGEGEMVALLGTNGAGKSTLLRVVSGLGIPQTGSVRFRGLDITHLDADRRSRHGITQVPGGKAVFGPMSVLDNLKVYGHALGRDPDEVAARIDECFAAFPRLRERQDQLAQTLSGGEQQMLALARALVLRPRLLLIDELSLGLAPIIVGELLEMVRRINATGTAVILVEQSVNVALSLVDRAYFMERGEVRFEGRAADLVGRDDLLRSVFLDTSSEIVSAPPGASPATVDVGSDISDSGTHA